MKTIKMIGCAGVASFALVLFVSSFSVTEDAQARTTSDNVSGNFVHRVRHTLAVDTRYNGIERTGGKWGENVLSSDGQAIWPDSKKGRHSGY